MLFLSLLVLVALGLLYTSLDAQETESETPTLSPPSPFSDLLNPSRTPQSRFKRQKNVEENGSMGTPNIPMQEAEKRRRMEMMRQGREPCLSPNDWECPPENEPARFLQDQKCLPYFQQQEKAAENGDNPLLSPFEAYVRGHLTSLSVRDVHQFGYDLFERPPAAFAPAAILPVGPDYLLGPGDEMHITLWGKINLDHFAVIDADGKIVLPDIGLLHLAGLTFADAKNYIEKELSRYYRTSEVRINISMGRLRSIRVFVVGQAACPGSYTLSSFASLLNAVLAAGGPTKLGTMRDIQVKRNGNTITHFDLYDLLLKGDKTKDLRLMPEDVVWIPSVGPLVGIVGHVKNPAIYELQGNIRLLDLIELAGGLTAIAFKGRVQVQRVVEAHLVTYFEGDLTDMGAHPEKNIPLQDGDIVRIFPVIEEKRVVTLVGAVGSPGEFALSPGTTRIKDILVKAGGLLYHAFDEGTLTRVHAAQEGPQTEYITVNFRKALEEGDSAHNIPLEMNDYIVVRSIPEWHLYRKVELKGEVRFPGQYTIKRDESLSSLLERAGGFTEKAYLKGAVLTRESVRLLQKKNLKETVDRLEQRLSSDMAGTLDTALTQESVILGQKASEQRKELIAKLRAVEPIGRLPIQLAPLDQFTGSPSDILMEENDILVVPEKPASVQVVGSVVNAGGYLYVGEMTLVDYLKKSGGVTKYADKEEIYILKVDGTAISRQQTNHFFFFDPFMDFHLDPGDTIVVPEKLDRFAWLRFTRDVVQVLYQIAVTAGVVINVL